MPDAPVLIDRFLEDAYEFDVDALSDGETTYIAGVMQHIEEAGVHSGDSECLLPPYQISEAVAHQLTDYTRRISRALCVRGLLNMQFALLDGVVYVIEANPRASRTVPFVSKATGVPLARLATDLALGARLGDLGLPPEGSMLGHAVKKPVFPFNKFPDASVYLGPEMRSTGEVMAWAPGIGPATQKAWIAAGCRLPLRGNAYISLNDRDKRRAPEIGRAFRDLGFELLATQGTAAALEAAGMTAVPMVTTLSGALALARAIGAQRAGETHVLSLQERLASWGRGAALQDGSPREASHGGV
jgi:carbamoyl-phosphate synthase large subunit